MKYARQNLKNNHGITLVELLVALAILLVVITLGARILGMGMLTYKQELHGTRQQLEMRQALQDITAAVRSGEAIAISDGKLTADTHAYALAQGTLYCRTKGQADTALCQSIAAFEATYADGILRLYLQSDDGYALQSSLRTDDITQEVQP